ILPEGSGNYDSRGSAGVKAATAYRDENGNIRAREIEWNEAQNGSRSNQVESAPAADDGTPKVEVLPGGVTRVSVNSSSRPLTSANSAEARQRAQYLERAREKVQQPQTPTRLPTIPTNKKTDK